MTAIAARLLVILLLLTFVAPTALWVGVLSGILGAARVIMGSFSILMDMIKGD